MCNMQFCMPQCFEGNFLYFGICSSCLPNCHTCSSQITCGKCFDGYYKRADEKECLPCDTNCAKCSGLGACNTCNEGFYVDSDGLCSPCSDNCKHCVNDNICLDCFEEFFLYNQTCTTKCPKNIFPSKDEQMTGKACKPLIFPKNKRINVTSPITNVSLMVPSNLIPDYKGEILMTFPNGFNTEDAIVTKFAENDRLHVQDSNVVKSIFIDVVSTNEDPLENVPEVQTITITDPYYTQHVDIIPSGDSMLDIDEIQTITIRKPVRQTVEPMASLGKCPDDTTNDKSTCLQHHPTLGYLYESSETECTNANYYWKVLEHVLIFKIDEEFLFSSWYLWSC